MNIQTYNQQLKPCLLCKSQTAEIFRNDKSVGVICNCGNQFTLDNPQTPFNEVVQWWNDNYGLDDKSDKSLTAKSKKTMKITVKQINILSFVKWHILGSLIAGFLTGIVYGLWGYYAVRDNLAGFLLWYVLGFTVLYGVMGLVSGLISGFLYNTLNHSLGGIKFEVESEELESNPPAPPSFVD